MRHLQAAASVAVLGSLLVAAPARAGIMELKWSTEGYFRTRTVFLTNLAPEDRRSVDYPLSSDKVVLPEIRRTSYIVSRLRLMPTLSYGKLASLHMQIDALDDVLWGDNNGISAAPLFATETSSQPFLGGPVGDSVTISRAWLEFQVPVGVMRVGRMPSHWGMGLLANGGGTARIDTMNPAPPGEPPRRASDYFFDDDFGDNHFGTTADRILFITKPLTIVRTAMKKKDTESNLIVGYAYDKLSEAPWLTAEGFERRYRPFGQQGFISRGKNDDVNEHVFLAVYNVPDWDVVRYTDEYKVGMYGVLRTEEEGSTFPSEDVFTDPNANCSGSSDPADYVECVDTGSMVWILDFWYKLRYGPWYSEAEALKIGGETFGGIPYPAKNKLRHANITSGVWRGGYLTDKLDGVLELGHASGDNFLEYGDFKQRAIHPDYNVGLILFEEILRERTARAFLQFASEENPDGAQGFASKGGVINSNYIYPKGRWRPGIGGLEVVGALLFAWVDTLPDSGVNGLIFPYSDEGRSKYLGTEADLAIKMAFAGKMYFSLESGLLIFGDALKARLPNADTSFTLQSRLAFMW